MKVTCVTREENKRVIGDANDCDIYERVGLDNKPYTFMRSVKGNARRIE